MNQCYSEYSAISCFEENEKRYSFLEGLHSLLVIHPIKKKTYRTVSMTYFAEVVPTVFQIIKHTQFDLNCVKYKDVTNDKILHMSIYKSVPWFEILRNCTFTYPIYNTIV